MPLNKSSGNMYPWVTHMHTHLGGQCPHKCTYCYVETPRFGRPKRYTGPLRLIEDEFKEKYGKGKTIFMEHKNDFLAAEVPDEFIVRIIKHAREWPDNTYVWQTKNPERYFSEAIRPFPEASIYGTTIETNRWMPDISNAPPPKDRVLAMERLSVVSRKFVTIEPVLDFDVDILAEWIARINPEFLNLGADSKGHGLPEPSVEKIMQLVEKLHGYGIELREKHNLNRLKKV